ncbi:MAG: PHP domain-containing protein [Ignavibacteria bacterium]|nr:PHP domain-containing protein [Ignavibacteria bacterium]
MSEKSELLQHFQEIIYLLEFHESNIFRINAYRNAMQALRSIDSDLQELINSGGLEEIKGIGKGIAESIMQFHERRTTDTMDELRIGVPDSLFELFEIFGLGPKRIHTLFYDLQICSIDELENACKNGQIADTKGFGERVQQNLLEEIARLRSHKNIILLPHALAFSDIFRSILRANSAVIQFTSVGQLRRTREIYSEISYLVLVNNRQAFIDELLRQGEIVRGEEILEISGYNVKVILHTAVTSAEYQEKELRLLNPAIEIKEETGEIFPETWEDEYYQIDKSSITLGSPTLNLKRIKGMIHFHTIWSDGNNSLKQMVEYGTHLGYSYFVVTDHSKSASYAHGLTEERVLMQREEARILSEQSGIPIFYGIESDILPDGSLDYSNDFLKNFDFVIASVHSHFTMPEEEMTQRIIRAIKHPATKLWGHPTGRLLSRRDGYRCDMMKIIEACAAYNTGIEINANPLRLDLDWRWMPYAQARGCMFSINSDAHSVDDIHYLQYGVLMARKGGLQESDVINCMNAEEFGEYISLKSWD